MPRFSVWTQTVLTKVTSLASDDAFALATNTPEAKAIERDDLIADIASDVLDELPLTTNGDLLTQAAGARARLTRADLAADIATDTAFSSAYGPIDGPNYIEDLVHTFRRQANVYRFGVSAASRDALGATLTGNNKWFGGVLGPDGKIYGIPSDSTDILIIDPIAGTATRSNMGATLTDTSKFVGGVLGPDGKIYGIPSKLN
jgi:hypothetical protein